MGLEELLKKGKDNGAVNRIPRQTLEFLDLILGTFELDDQTAIRIGMKALYHITTNLIIDRLEIYRYVAGLVEQRELFKGSPLVPFEGGLQFVLSDDSTPHYDEQAGKQCELEPKDVLEILKGELSPEQYYVVEFLFNRHILRADILISGESDREINVPVTREEIYERLDMIKQKIGSIVASSYVLRDGNVILPYRPIRQIRFIRGRAEICYERCNFGSMSNDKITEYYNAVFEGSGIRQPELRKIDTPLYNELKRRGLLDQLVPLQRKDRGYWTRETTFSEICLAIESGITTIGQLRDLALSGENNLYFHAREYGLLHYFENCEIVARRWAC